MKRRPDHDRLVNDSNGSLIAVSYEARASGVKRCVFRINLTSALLQCRDDTPAVRVRKQGEHCRRNMRGDDARAACPELQIVQVPTAHGKADLTFYRSTGKKVRLPDGEARHANPSPVA